MPGLKSIMFGSFMIGAGCSTLMMHVLHKNFKYNKNVPLK